MVSFPKFVFIMKLTASGLREAEEQFPVPQALRKAGARILETPAMHVTIPASGQQLPQRSGRVATRLSASSYPEEQHTGVTWICALFGWKAQVSVHYLVGMCLVPK